MRLAAARSVWACVCVLAHVRIYMIVSPGRWFVCNDTPKLFMYADVCTGRWYVCCHDVPARSRPSLARMEDSSKWTEALVTAHQPSIELECAGSANWGTSSLRCLHRTGTDCTGCTDSIRTRRTTLRSMRYASCSSAQHAVRELAPSGSLQTTTSSL